MRTADSLAKLYVPSGWYNDACASVDAISRAAETSRERVATVIAALSPQTSVASNIRSSLALLAGLERVNGVLGASWTKAAQGIVAGPKVEAFRANLLGDWNQITLDVWAWRALGFNEAPNIRSKAGAKLWRQGFARYRKAAQLLQVPPAECQAGVWSAIRVSADYRFRNNPLFSRELAKLAEPIPERYSVAHWAYTTHGAERVQALAQRAMQCL